MTYIRSAIRLIIVASMTFSTAVAHGQSRRIDNDSDWWSILRTDTLPPGATVLKRKPPDSIFRVAGIELGATSEDKHISQTYGPAEQIERGDASTGRYQVCYASPSGDLHLIFEFGEVESVAYLIAGSQPWDGESECVRTSAITPRLQTANGLTIGSKRERVRELLGVPSLSTPDRLYYVFEYSIKPTAAELRRLRKDNPQMSDAEFRSNFSDLDVTAIIDARFTGDELRYIAISRSETY